MLATLTILRGVQLLGLVSLLGTLTTRCVVAPGLFAGHAALVRLARVSLLLGLVAVPVWLLAEAAAFADANTVGDAVAALPTVMQSTRLGHVLAIRFALLVAAWPLIARGRAACAMAALLVAVALALQGAVGHAGAMAGRGGEALLATEALHLIAAGAWLGGLLPLLILIRTLPRQQAAAAARRFTRVGLPAVVVLIGTALAQSRALVGGISGLLETDYGHLVLLKLVLFGILLALAAFNRFVLTSRFESGRAGRTALLASIGIEILAGVAVVMAAAALASQMPALNAAVYPRDAAATVTMVMGMQSAAARQPAIDRIGRTE